VARSVVVWLLLLRPARLLVLGREVIDSLKHGITGVFGKVRVEAGQTLQHIVKGIGLGCLLGSLHGIRLLLLGLSLRLIHGPCGLKVIRDRHMIIGRALGSSRMSG